jgi:hypothetical protein
MALCMLSSSEAPSLKTLSIVAALLLFGMSASSSTACTMVTCLNRGRELRSDFLVSVTHDDKPLAGVTVQILRDVEDNHSEFFSGKTDTDGAIRIRKLGPGDYLLNVELLGIFAEGACFHVSRHASTKAEKKVSVVWGEFPHATRQIAGSLVNSQLGRGGSPPGNLTHRVDVVISNAKLTLRGPFTDAVYEAVSDAYGHFAFRGIPDGLYVLHLEGGATPDGRTFEQANLLFRLSDSAKQKIVVVKLYDPAGGSCGGWQLDPDYNASSLWRPPSEADRSFSSATRHQSLLQAIFLLTTHCPLLTLTLAIAPRKG